MPDTPPPADGNPATVDNTAAVRDIIRRRITDAMSVLTDTLNAIDDSTPTETLAGLDMALIRLGRARKVLEFLTTD